MIFTSRIPPVVLAVTLFAAVANVAAEDASKVKGATRQVESGAKEIGSGVAETAKGIGNTIVEGAKATGDKLKESGQAAEPRAKSAWEHTKQGASDFGHSVKNFFSRLFQ